MNAPDSTDHIWGIGRYQYLSAADHTNLPVSVARHERDIAFVREYLAAASCVPGSVVVQISSVAEVAQYSPFTYAAIEEGMPLAAAEPSPYDASRVFIFGTGLNPRAIIGVRPETLQGLADIDKDPAECLSGASLVLATPPAHVTLRELGIAARRLVPIGPALALECFAGSFHISDAWQFDDQKGQLTVGSRVGVPKVPHREIGVSARMPAAPCTCELGGESIVLEELDVRA